MPARAPWLLALSLCLFAACSHVAAATREPATALGKLLLSPEDEAAIGEQLAAQVEQQEKILDDEETQRFVREVGARIADAVPEGERRFPFQIQVIDSPGTVNAFALPGGYLYIYSGLIAAAESEAELASVLGHEVAHVTLGHASQQLAAQVGTEALAALALGNDPGLVAQLAAGIAAQGYLAAYSRMDEEAADSTGLGYLAGAGYEAEAMASFFRKLQRMESSDRNAVAAFFASHPAPKDRVEAIERMIRERGYEGGRSSIVGGLDGVKSRLESK